ncbi:MAG: Flp pilus assembly complex ATPase component TadA [Phycisphaerales bacterium]|nr:Flp pilus assembly complex ATPase component TadA [Phycisphaerales bacterium]
MTQAAHNASMVAPRFNGGALRELLIARGLLTASDWRIAQEVAKQQGLSEVRALLDLGQVGEEQLADALCQLLSLTRWTLDANEAQLTEHVPIGFMQSGMVLVLEAQALEEQTAPDIHIVLADPSDKFTVMAVLARFAPGGDLAQHPVRLFVGTHKEVAAFLEERAHDGEIESAQDDGAIDVSAELSQLRDMASEAPVIRFFNQVVERAMDLGASDIHLERFEQSPRLRLRVDGVLREETPPPANMYEALLCRIKILGGLDIAERRRAQDGRVRMRLRGRGVDLRVGIVPTMYGQDAAIRIQDRQQLADIELADLGFTQAQSDALFGAAAKSHGILLITGPTGSGKTTTLYAILRKLVSSERKIMTVEDPVEYAQPGVNQMQVNPAINMTFGNSLRHILRHDPDVILVGEIRDQETAQMAFQASLTGHLVMSTLHTNDVPGSFVRLVDMGVEPYLVNAAVEGISAQRLMRRLDAQQPRNADGSANYRGRVAVMEYGRVTSAVKQAMLQGAEEGAIRRALLAGGFEPMRLAAERLVAQGMTDEAEMLRVLGANDPDVATEAGA